MKSGSRRNWVGLTASILLICLFWSSAPVRAEGILNIASFNIQFLGNPKNRDNEALASVVKDYDIVVIQELVAPPYEGTFPDGTPYKADPEAKVFFDKMAEVGFTYALSPEDTGTGDHIHLNSTATEWWVTFFKTNKVELAADLPTGFLAGDRSNHPSYERVPFAFGFRTKDRKADFVLISVHLMPGASDKARRKEELNAIAQWIEENNEKEKDFIILGDMNIENAAELKEATPQGFVSLNARCVPTNTNQRGPKPYDHVMYSPVHTTEIDGAYGFKVIDLIREMQPVWERKNPGKPYPGNPYNHDAFRGFYSDHHPVAFRLTVAASGDDD